MVQFRMKALNQLQKPDDLDLLMKVTKRRGWIALGTLALAAAALIAWSFTGSLPVQVEADGILSTPNGVSRIDSTVEGQVTDVRIADGAQLATGDIVATVIDASGEPIEVTAVYPGTVTSVFIDGGNVVEQGTPLYLIERSDLPDTRLVAHVFVPSGKGESLAPGMDVDLSVASAPSAAFGVLRGRVTSVDPYPATELELYELLGDEQLAARFTEDGPPVVVLVDLLPDDSTVSGLKWSTDDGPPFPLGPGVDVSALIIQGEQRPVDLVFGR